MISRIHRLLFPLFVLINLLGTPLLVSAQGLGGGMGDESGRIEGKVKFMPIPYVNYDRSLGFTVGAVPMLMFNPS